MPQPPVHFALGSLLALTLSCGNGDTKSKPGPTVVDAATDARQDASPKDAGIDAPVYSGPEKLSETGLYSDIKTKTLAADVLPYEVRYPLWSDGSKKTRYLYLPPGTKIDTQDINAWKFPIGTKAWKDFEVEGKLVETRFLHKLKDGPQGWLWVAFKWNGDEAVALPLGEKDVFGTTHDIPDQAACDQCHHGTKDALAGIDAIQLSAAGGKGLLSTLAASGRLTHPPATEFQIPGDSSIEPVLGYLHGNCGNCHNDTHFLADDLVMRLRFEIGAQSPEQTTVYQTALGTKAKHDIQNTTQVIAIGKPLESQLWVRMSYRAIDSMPPLGTEKVDTKNLKLIESWIKGLTPQP